MPDGVLAIKIDPATGIRADNDSNAVYDYFYHENPPPEAEVPLPPMTDGEGATDALNSQVQHVLQPEISHVVPAPGTASNTTVPNKPPVPAPAKKTETPPSPANVILKPLN